MDKKTLGKNVRKRLVELGISQRDLAKSIRITDVSMCRYIKGERTPNVYTALKIADALNCSIYDLVE